MLEVSGVYTESVDRRALQQAAVDQRIDSWLEENPGSGEELSLDGERRAVEYLFRQTFPEQPLDAIVAAHTVTDEAGEASQLLDQAAYVGALREQLVVAEASGGRPAGTGRATRPGHRRDAAIRAASKAAPAFHHGRR